MLTQEELGSGKNTTKVEQYGWSIVDEIGELMWLSKAILNVDPAYQREKVKLNRILSISRAWSWVACGTLIVAKRTDGKYFVIDGQHRKLAADKRADILNLPCMVFDAVDIPDEASAFLRVNIARSPVGALGKFKSEIIAGDKVAAKVTSMVTESGYRIGASSGPEYSTVCVGLLKQCMVRSEPVTAQVWALCVDLSNGRTITDRLFGSLFEL